MADAKRESPINSALRQFEATEANLVKLGRVWAKIIKLTPSGLAFGGDATYEEHVRSYEDLLHALPADGSQKAFLNGYCVPMRQTEDAISRCIGLLTTP